MPTWCIDAGGSTCTFIAYAATRLDITMHTAVFWRTQAKIAIHLAKQRKKRHERIKGTDESEELTQSSPAMEA